MKKLNSPLCKSRIFKKSEWYIYNSDSLTFYSKLSYNLQDLYVLMFSVHLSKQGTSQGSAAEAMCFHHEIGRHKVRLLADINHHNSISLTDH